MEYTNLGNLNPRAAMESLLKGMSHDALRAELSTLQQQHDALVTALDVFIRTMPQMVENLSDDSSSVLARAYRNGASDLSNAVSDRLIELVGPAIIEHAQHQADAVRSFYEDDDTEGACDA